MDGIGTSNQRLLHMVNIRQKLYLEKPEIFFPWRKPCSVNALLVVDGLDFGMGDFGLSTFVDVLKNDGRSYVRYDLTLAHLNPNASDAAVQVGAPGIARSIKGFVFDDSNHFTPTMYDEVWMFGIVTGGPVIVNNFHSFANRQLDPTRYPADRLGDGELDALTAHMNRGGGIFATGDHGELGKALCGSVDRLRSMRYWQDFGPGEVSMSGPRRNDSNAIGQDPGSQFSDQSDDIPQRLDLRLYSTRINRFSEARYPHPVMCSRLGRIDVFPDHPHEGECREPTNLSGTCRDGSPEFPSPDQASPEVIATGRVPAGNTASSRNGQSLKQPTQAHTFGVVSAYDGHRVARGRVVCDSTWHHFVNVNLIGVVEGAGFDDFDTPGHPGTPGTHTSKHVGFLYSPAGRAALDKIKEYYVNIGVWIAPAENIRCMNSRLWWELIYTDRIVEATLTEFTKPWAEIPLHQLYAIGIHARDVIGRQAGACQSIAFMLPDIEFIWEELRPWIDPWGPLDPGRLKEPALPWFDPQPLVDIAIGGAVAALRESFPAVPTAEVLDGQSTEIIRKAAAVTFGRALNALRGDMKSIDQLIAAGRQRIGS